ncbi:hypothetical protein SDC9_110602 [bioreactor metagenome]|uniref:Uncharacterized protein n=1 Tax=bioreactor metagenome TaxID=1076179 RepID=A0A645BE43_9ZZZZ
MLMRKKTSCTAVSRLNFIENKNHTMFMAGLFKLLHKSVLGNENSGYALNSFRDNGCDIAFFQFTQYLVGIVQGDECYFVPGVERRLDRRVVGYGNSTRCASVERSTERDYSLFPRVERGQF